MEKNKENRKIILVLFLGVLMGALDIAVVGPALNPIKNWFHASGRDMTWIFTSYVLMNLVGTPILAKISDALGKKPVYIASLITFAFGSLVVTLAPVFPVLIIGRAVQGFGAGGIFPVASAVIGDTFPPAQRGKMLGLIGAVFGIAFIIGPAVGGLLLLLGWQWIFVVNLPVALLVIILAIKYIPKSKVQKGEKFDWLGTLVISGMLASFVYGTNQIETHQILSSIVSQNVYPYLLGALALLLALIYIEGKAQNPIVAPSLFDSRQLKIAHVLSFGSGFFQACLIYLPTLTIATFFVSSSVSSFMLLPTVLAVAIASPFFGKMLDKHGSKVVISIGTLILSVGILSLAIFITNWYMFFISTAFIGFGLSALLGAPIRYILLNEVSETNRSSAQGIITIFTSSGQLIGAAVIGAIINSGNNPVIGFRKAFIIIGAIAAALYIFSNYLKGRQEEVFGLTEVTEV